MDRAKRSRGKLFFPTTTNAGDEDSLAKCAGADALTQTPEIGSWLGSLFPKEKIYIYSLIYLDGEKYVRASMAMDVIVDTATTIRGPNKVGLLYIATPSAAHVVDAGCETLSKKFRKNAPWWQKLFETFGILKKQKFYRLNPLLTIESSIVWHPCRDQIMLSQIFADMSHNYRSI